MRFREHRGSLADALATTVEIDGGRDKLIGYLQRLLFLWPTAPRVTEESIHIEPYFGDDDRIGWKDVHIVTLDGYGVVGFTEGPAA